jgi:RNA polymerase sigma-70 factor (ECF subfamily)
MAKRRPGTATRRADFEQLYERCHRDLWAVAFARLGDSNLAMEFMQEAFLRLWRIWGTPDQPESAKAWLVTVVRNLAEDEAKSSFRKNGTRSPEWLGGILSNRTGPVEQVLHRETRATVREALSQLSDLDREILTMRYGLEREIAEIAESLGIQPSAVYMRLSRARHHLAAQLGATIE